MKTEIQDFYNAIQKQQKLPSQQVESISANGFQDEGNYAEFNTTKLFFPPDENEIMGNQYYNSAYKNLEKFSKIESLSEDDRASAEKLSNYFKANFEVSQWFYGSNLAQEDKTPIPKKEMITRLREYDFTSCLPLTGENSRKLLMRASLIGEFKQALLDNASLPENFKDKLNNLDFTLLPKPNQYEICLELAYADESDITKLTLSEEALPALNDLHADALSTKADNVGLFSRLTTTGTSPKLSQRQLDFIGYTTSFLNKNIISLSELVIELEHVFNIASQFPKAYYGTGFTRQDPIPALANISLKELSNRLNLDNLGFAQDFYTRLLQIRTADDKKKAGLSISYDSSYQSRRSLIDKLITHLESKRYTLKELTSSPPLDSATFIIPEAADVSVDDWNEFRRRFSGSLAKDKIMQSYASSNHQFFGTTSQNLTSASYKVSNMTMENQNIFKESLKKINFESLTEKSVSTRFFITSCTNADNFSACHETLLANPTISESTKKEILASPLHPKNLIGKTPTVSENVQQKNPKVAIKKAEQPKNAPSTLASTSTASLFHQSQSTNDVKKSEADLLSAFHAEHRPRYDTVKAKKFGRWRSSLVAVEAGKTPWSLGEILNHAIEDKGSRSHRVCITLGWLNKNGELNSTHSDFAQLNEALTQFKNSTRPQR